MIPELRRGLTPTFGAIRSIAVLDKESLLATARTSTTPGLAAGEPLETPQSLNPARYDLASRTARPISSLGATRWSPIPNGTATSLVELAAGRYLSAKNCRTGQARLSAFSAWLTLGLGTARLGELVSASELFDREEPPSELSAVQVQRTLESAKNAAWTQHERGFVESFRPKVRRIVVLDERRQDVQHEAAFRGRYT